MRAPWQRLGRCKDAVTDNFSQKILWFSCVLTVLWKIKTPWQRSGNAAWCDRRFTTPVSHFWWIFFILAGNMDTHKFSDGFKIWPDLTLDCGSSCPWASGKSPYTDNGRNVVTTLVISIWMHLLHSCRQEGQLLKLGWVLISSRSHHLIRS